MLLVFKYLHLFFSYFTKIPMRYILICGIFHGAFGKLKLKGTGWVELGWARSPRVSWLAQENYVVSFLICWQKVFVKPGLLIPGFRVFFLSALIASFLDTWQSYVSFRLFFKVLYDLFFTYPRLGLNRFWIRTLDQIQIHTLKKKKLSTIKYLIQLFERFK